MPRVDDDIQNCVIHLYQTVEDARAGRRAGGSGFVIAVDSAMKQEHRLLYTIANSRMIKNGFPVIRADNINHEIPPFEKGAKDWVHHPAGEDVAACLLGRASDYPQVSYYPFERSLTRESLDRLGVGVGSDVFLMGRHITVRGGQCPAPVARFGKLAMADHQSVRQPDGQSRECFVVAVFEPGEHSGAPVFVHSNHPSDHEPSHRGATLAPPWLLGVDQGHLQRYRPVIDARGERHPRGWKVLSPNGLIAVMPVWRLRELLGTEQLREAKRKIETHLVTTQERGASALNGGREFTRAAYLDMLRLVSVRIGAITPATEEQSAARLSSTQAESEQEYTLEDFKRDFPDEATCLNWLKDYLYPDGIQCRKCRHITPHARDASRRSYSCARCGRHVHPTVGTIYHYSRKPLHLWFEAIYWMASIRGLTTAMQLKQELKVNYKTAGRMWKEIRKMLSRSRA